MKLTAHEPVWENMNKIVHTTSESETTRLGERLGAALRPGDVIALVGDLGAGKTTITKGIARGMGIRSEVASPTFTLVHEHRGELPLYHIDLYRIESEDLIPDIGIEEYLYGNGVAIVEWAERMQNSLPDTALVIRLTSIGDTERTIELSALSPRWSEVVEELSR